VPPPVARFLDFGQYKYELTKREKEAKRKQRSVTFKEVRLTPKIGVGDSTRFLVKHKGTMARLAAPGGFTGERFLEQCAPVLARPEAHVTGLHVYTFNQVAETEAWRRSYLDKLMAVSRRG